MDIYEKKYNEALEKAKKYLAQDDADIEPGERKIILALFPELRKSEDERMLNMAIKAVKAPEAQSCIKSWGVNPDDVIAWLKKQKETLHIAESCKENAKSFADESEDERIRKWIIEEFKIHYNLESPRTLNPMVEKALAWLEKQKELSVNGKGLYYYDGEKFTYCGYPATEENLESQDIDFSTNDTSKNEARKRRQIIALLSASKGKCMASFTKDIDECVAYLIEKQKEQKKDNPLEDYSRGYNDGYCHGITDREQKEQKEFSFSDAYALLSKQGYIILEMKEYDKLIEKIEKRQNIELIQRSWYMEGYNDRESGKEPMWIIKTGKGGPKYEPNLKYGQPLAGEQKPADHISVRNDFDLDGNLKQKPTLFIPKFRVGDKVVSTNNTHLTYDILEVGHINSLGNPEYKVEIFQDGKPGIFDKQHNIKFIECRKLDGWGELVQKFAEKQDYFGLTDFERAIHRGFLCAGVENVPVTIIKETAQDCLAQIKPAWSEEDKENLDNIIWLCENCEKGIEHTWIPSQATEIKNLIKRIKSYCFQPKAEWSEEDENMLNDLFAIIEYSGISKSEKDKFNLWLKSLRPSWKPSEEQMKALDSCIPKSAQPCTLQSLYNELKKL